MHARNLCFPVVLVPYGHVTHEQHDHGSHDSCILDAMRVPSEVLGEFIGKLLVF